MQVKYTYFVPSRLELIEQYEKEKKIGNKIFQKNEEEKFRKIK